MRHFPPQAPVISRISLTHTTTPAPRGASYAASRVTYPIFPTNASETRHTSRKHLSLSVPTTFHMRNPRSGHMWSGQMCHFCMPQLITLHPHPRQAHTHTAPPHARACASASSTCGRRLAYTKNEPKKAPPHTHTHTRARTAPTEKSSIVVNSILIHPHTPTQRHRPIFPRRTYIKRGAKNRRRLYARWARR